MKTPKRLFIERKFPGDFWKIVSYLTSNQFGQYILEVLFIGIVFLRGFFIKGYYAQENEKNLSKILKKNSSNNKKITIFDVGANVGQFCLSNMKRFHSLGDISLHCFEPISSSFHQLKKNVQGQGIKFNKEALGRKKELKTMYVASTEKSAKEPNRIMASLTKTNMSHLGIENCLVEKVKVNTLDSYVKKNNTGFIDLLKIDVEGHEYDVLVGGKKLFEENRIGLVYFEFNSCNIDSRYFFKDFFFLFKKYNFTIYRCTAIGKLLPIKYYQEDFEIFFNCDLYAINNQWKI